MRFEDFLDVTSEPWLWFSLASFIGAAGLLLNNLFRHP